MQSPSFETDSELDAAVKKEVISQSMMMACVSEQWLLDNADDLVPGFILPRADVSSTTGASSTTSPPAQGLTPGAGSSSAVVADDAQQLTPYARGILQLREAFEDQYCGRFVRVLPFQGEGDNPVWCCLSAACLNCFADLLVG